MSWSDDEYVYDDTFRPTYRNRRSHARPLPYVNPPLTPPPVPFIPMPLTKPDPPKPAYGSYRDHLVANLSGFPEYAALRDYLDRPADATAASSAKIHILDFPASWSDASGVSCRSFDVSCAIRAIEAKPKDGLRLIIVSHAGREGVSAELVQELGLKFDVDPSFFINHMELADPGVGGKSTPFLMSEGREDTWSVVGHAGHKVSAFASVMEGVENDDNESICSDEDLFDDEDVQTVIMLVRDDGSPLTAQRLMRQCKLKPSVYRIAANVPGADSTTTLTDALVAVLRSSGERETDAVVKRPNTIVFTAARLLLLECSAALESLNDASRSEDANHKELTSELDALETVLKGLNSRAMWSYSYKWSNPRKYKAPARAPRRYGARQPKPPKPFYHPGAAYDRDAGALLRQLNQVRDRVEDPERAAKPTRDVAETVVDMPTEDVVATPYTDMKRCNRRAVLVAAMLLVLPFVIAAVVFDARALAGLDLPDWVPSVETGTYTNVAVVGALVVLIAAVALYYTCSAVKIVVRGVCRVAKRNVSSLFKPRQKYTQLLPSQTYEGVYLIDEKV